LAKSKGIEGEFDSEGFLSLLEIKASTSGSALTLKKSKGY
jgi:hypothetical protein